MNTPAHALTGTGSPGLVPGPVRRASDQPAGGAHSLLAIGSLAAGGYLLAWLQEAAGAAPALRARRFDAQGQPAGPELAVPDPSAGATQVALAALAGDALALAFVREAPAPTGVRSTVVLQRIDLASLQPGPEQELAAVVRNPDPSAPSRLLATPSVVRWDDGRFLVGWSLVEQDGNRQQQIWTQRFDAAGQPLAGPVLAGRGEPGTGYRLAAAPGGGHLLTTFGRVMGRTYLQYAAWGGAVAPALPAGALGVAEGSLLLPLYGGRSVLVAPGGSGASVQAYAATGQALGTAGALQAMPLVLAALRDGSWLAFTADPAGPLQAQQFDADGVRLRPPFAAAAAGAVPQAAALADGGLALAWTDAAGADVLTQVLRR